MTPLRCLALAILISTGCSPSGSGSGSGSGGSGSAGSGSATGSGSAAGSGGSGSDGSAAAPVGSDGSGGGGSAAVTAVGSDTPVAEAKSTGTQVTLTNRQTSPITVYVAFGAGSQIKAADWKSFCAVASPLTCSFSLPTGSKRLPNPSGKHLNATIAFGAAVGCGATKAELDVNNAKWFDTLDVSLVDEYSNQIEIDYKPPGGAATKLGPPVGKTGNEKVLGVFPYGCDVCVARQNPPCGIAKGKDGCKAGTQYKPDVPCQYQGAVKGGGGAVDVILLP